MTEPDPAAGPASPPHVPVPRTVQPMVGPPIDKSVGAALVLTFFFGPFGLFYTSVRDAIIAIIVSIIVGLITIGFGLFLVWPVCMVWAAVTASKKHQEFEAWKIEKLSGGAHYA